MPIYKFHDPQFTKQLLSGSFMLSSLDYFAVLPWLTGDQKIGDVGEVGARMVQTSPLAWGPGVAPVNAKFLAEQRVVSVAEGFQGTISINGLQIIYADEPAHIFSMAVGELDELTNSMPSEYQAVIEIVDPEGLAQAIWNEGVTVAGTPFRDLVGEPKVEEVTYGGRTTDLSGTTAPERGPFRKDTQWEDQRELRIHFRDLRDWVRDRLVVKINDADRFLKLVRSGEVAQNNPIDELPDLQQASLAALAAQRLGEDQTEVMRRLIWRWRLERGIRAHMTAPYDSGAAAWVILQDATRENAFGGSTIVQMPS